VFEGEERFMGKRPYRSVFTTCKSSEGITLKCSILRGKIVDDYGASRDSYGIKLTSSESGESAEIPNVTLSRRNIIGLAAKVVRNAVTPVSLKEVVYDWLVDE
jgi:hypothetical protein